MIIMDAKASFYSTSCLILEETTFSFICREEHELSRIRTSKTGISNRRLNCMKCEKVYDLREVEGHNIEGEQPLTQ